MTIHCLIHAKFTINYWLAKHTVFHRSKCILTSFSDDWSCLKKWVIVLSFSRILRYMSIFYLNIVLKIHCNIFFVCVHLIWVKRIENYLQSTKKQHKSLHRWVNNLLVFKRVIVLQIQFNLPIQPSASHLLRTEMKVIWWNYWNAE